MLYSNINSIETKLILGERKGNIIMNNIRTILLNNNKTQYKVETIEDRLKRYLESTTISMEVYEQNKEHGVLEAAGQMIAHYLEEMLALEIIKNTICTTEAIDIKDKVDKVSSNEMKAIIFYRDIAWKIDLQQ